MSRGVCGIIVADMKTLRFLCFASLLALIICLAGGGHIGLADEADPAGMATPRQEKACKPPTAVDLRGSTPPENLLESEPSGNRSSGSIMITMTTAAEGPGIIPGE